MAKFCIRQSAIDWWEKQREKELDNVRKVRKMEGTKNDTFIITHTAKGYKVEAWTNGEKNTQDFEDVQQATEWIEKLKGEQENG